MATVADAVRSRGAGYDDGARELAARWVFGTNVPPDLGYLKNLARRMQRQTSSERGVLVAIITRMVACLPRLSGEEAADCQLFFTTLTC